MGVSPRSRMRPTRSRTSALAIPRPRQWSSGAHGADLRVAGQAHPHPGHGHEGAGLVANTEVVAQLDRAALERPGMGATHQREHVVHVVRAEQVCVGRRRGLDTGRHHLRCRDAEQLLPSVGHTRRRQTGQLLHARQPGHEGRSMYRPPARQEPPRTRRHPGSYLEAPERLSATFCWGPVRACHTGLSSTCTRGSSQ